MRPADTRKNSLGNRNILSAEIQYLAKLPRNIPHADYEVPSSNQISDKVIKLIEALLQEPPDFTGNIFVRGRAIVSVLSSFVNSSRYSRPVSHWNDVRNVYFGR